MAYNHEYPYTDPERYNDDWLLNKMKELEEKIIGIEEDIFAKSKLYIDEVLAPYQAEVTQLRSEFTAFKNEVNNNFSTFTAQLTAQQQQYQRNVDAQITLMNQRIDALRDELNADIQSVNARTDLAIQQNNDYIFEVLSTAILGELKVTNFFTGERVTVQQMFDYLATLHVTDGLNYDELVIRDKTYTELVALNIDYTNLVLHGNSLVI